MSSAFLDLGTTRIDLGLWPYPMGGGPVWQTGGYGFVLTMGAKVGRTPDWGFTSRPDLEGVDCSDRLQIMVSYNRLSEISTIRLGVCIAQ